MQKVNLRKIERKLNGDEVAILIFHSRGARMRRRILKVLESIPRNCNQIAEELEVDWWTVQKHLKKLLEAGLIREINLGRQRFYKMTPRGEQISRHMNDIP